MATTMLMGEGLGLLSEEECLRLLSRAEVGRVGLTVGALPVILPVSYALVDGDVVFRAGNGPKLQAAVRDAVIAFEIDMVDPRASTGWSVLVVGTASDVASDDRAKVATALGVKPGDQLRRSHFVRLHPELLSGRRITGDA